MHFISETENLHRLTRSGMFHCFLVREGQELILVVSNFPGSCDAILRAASSLQCPITKIALTHAHFDHVGSLDALVKVLPDAQVCLGTREARLLHGDFSLDPGESGKPLLGFQRVHSPIHRLLDDDDKIGSLCAVACPGHPPGHLAFLDVRDNSLLAGDSFITQSGVIAAGVFGMLFPMPWLFS
jgi:glyoxylase-like metal-dependent hydrolase (beta-lactamase superfamily II)